ncbi:unnamed protein product [Fraxinus pennsylvanica]|uniref:U-box domain-containing protein n=1 Tax=Fraxinus pennsylvanica TaxID=56036 RepID=A0AAD2ACT9_9LAMI|nr:unnamed protein product [Fraxinus pennsylvanica]
MILKSALNVANPVQLFGVKHEFFIEIVQILHDKISQQASKAALKLLVELCPWGINRIKAVESGLVSALIELLLDTSERRACELILTVLEKLCGCPEGLAELLKHGAALDKYVGQAPCNQPAAGCKQATCSSLQQAVQGKGAGGHVGNVTCAAVEGYEGIKRDCWRD